MTKDIVTNVFNRAKIEEIFQYEFIQLKRYNKPFSILLIHITDIKELKMKFDHNKVDNYLIEISNILKKHERKADTIGKWDCDKFIFLLPHTNEHGADNLASKILTTLDSHSFLDNTKHNVLIGISQYRPHDNDEYKMIQRAKQHISLLN